MDEFADAMMHNLPEMLARDLAEQEDVFLAKSMTSGGPAADLVFEAQAPNVPQRNPSRVLHRLHQVAPETFLCSLRQNNVESAWRSEREAILKNTAFAASHASSPRALRRDHTSVTKQIHMKLEPDQESGRLFLNGLDDGWGSDSSADAEAGLSSPSVRTRKQSITTAATSVDLQLYCGEKGAEDYSTEPYSSGGCPAGAQLPGDQFTGNPAGFHLAGNYSTREHTQEALVNSPDSHVAWLARKEGGSWVHFGVPENMHTRLEMPGDGRRIELSGISHRLDQAQPHAQSTTMFTTEDDCPRPRRQPPHGVPERRSSLSHQVTTVSLDETSDSPKSPSLEFSQELASQVLLPSPPTWPREVPSHRPSQTDWDETEAASGPVVPTGHRIPRQNIQLDLSSISPDQLSLPPLATTETNPHDRAFSLRSQQQQPSVLSKPRKSRSVTRMPLRNVHHWLESSNRARQPSPPPLPITSPVTSSPTSSVRVSGPVLEALRINVQNFPDTMLRTSSVTIDQIRDYSHKLKRSDATRQLVPNHESNENTIAAPQYTTPPTSPSVGRKSSFGNLKLMSSLRGKFSRSNTASASSINEYAETNWSPSDDAAPATVLCDSPPLRPSAARDAACVNALRCILPRGTPYLLDALYAHVIAYNYIESLCGSLLQPPQDSAVSHLRTRPSKNAILPPGVTSLADLMVQENVSETVVQDFHDDVASVASKSVVPSKAASLLGLGSTNMSKPVKPNPGLIGGRDTNKVRKPSPPGTFKGHYLESGSAMRSLRDDIAHNIYRLVETVKTSSSAEGVDTEEAQEGNIVLNGKKLDDMLMRALSELVRCYEELSC